MHPLYLKTNKRGKIALIKKAAVEAAFLSCDPVGTRTQDPYIKSVLLYQLSYEINRVVLSNGTQR